MKVIHSMGVTAANIADSAALPDLLHGDETKVWVKYPPGNPNVGLRGFLPPLAVLPVTYAPNTV
jgi:hypothetical protein